MSFSKWTSIPLSNQDVFTSKPAEVAPIDAASATTLTSTKTDGEAKAAKRVLDEIEYILQKYPHIKIIDPIDDNVFVDEYRVKEMCQGLIDRKLGVQWRANCRFDYLANYDKRVS